ncbi:MAG TPA: hypothetical protein VMR19_01630 [Candidatus Saccharimonadales bacterium]|nr:hypothetical protein [Candidatus Saccharimonadales bacterium]
MKSFEARDFDPSRFEAPALDSCPTCDRPLMRLGDFPAVRIDAVRRLPIPEGSSEDAVRAMTTAEADIVYEKLEDLANSNDVIPSDGIRPPLKKYGQHMWGSDCGDLMPNFVYGILSGSHGEAILGAFIPFLSGDKIRYTQVGAPIAEIKYRGFVRRPERVELFPSDE